MIIKPPGDTGKCAVLALCMVAGNLRGCPTPRPQITPASGTYTCPLTVSIHDANRSATIYYTTDGSTPTTASTVYTGQLTLNRTEKVRAVALAPVTISVDVTVAGSDLTATTTTNVVNPGQFSPQQAAFDHLLQNIISSQIFHQIINPLRPDAPFIAGRTTSIHVLSNIQDFVNQFANPAGASGAGPVH